jgi:hypothetical protein
LHKEATAILNALLPPIDGDPVRAAGSEDLEDATKVTKGGSLDRACGAFILGKTPTRATLKTFKTGF